MPAHQKALILITLSIILLFFSTKTIFRVPGFFQGYVIGGIQKGLYSVGEFFSRTIGAVSELSTIREEYETLLQKVQNYEMQSREYAPLKEENIRLKQLLDLSSLPDAKKIAAHIIARDPSSTYSSIVIDKGSSDGIKKYMTAIAYQNGVEGLIGKIIEVQPTTSLLQAVYDQSFFAAARLAKTRTEGMINGQGHRDSPLSLLYISKTEIDQLKQGDIVVTSGLDRIFPPDIILGRVENFKINDYSSSLNIDVIPAIDSSKIEYVFVIEPPPLAPNAIEDHSK
jgi:rod shape-determining protein MreC